MEKEKCILCDKETEWDIELNTEFRYNYVDGAGQLCGECYDKTYGSEN